MLGFAKDKETLFKMREAEVIKNKILIKIIF